MLAASMLGLGIVGGWSGTGLRPALAGIALAAAIVLYDWHHKENPLSPLVMGALPRAGLRRRGALRHRRAAARRSGSARCCSSAT